MTDVWIDTDPSIGLPGHEADDGFALVQAFHSPELRIRGISTTYGNAGLRTTDRIAREMARRFGGAAGVGEERVFAGAVSAGESGAATAATEALLEALEERPLTYLALAPLTNLATLLRRHPELAGRIERVIFVGGRSPGVRFRAGRWNPYEFTDGNFHKDNAAAALVLGEKRIPLTLVPVEVALTWLLRPGELRRIGREGGAAGRYLARQGWLWVRLWRWCFAVEGGVVFDCFAVLAATHPEFFEVERRTVAVVRDARGRGGENPRDVHLVAREMVEGAEGGREVTFCRAVRRGGWEVILERLRGGGGRKG